MTVNLKSLVVPLGGYCNHCFDTGYKRKTPYKSNNFCHVTNSSMGSICARSEGSVGDWKTFKKSGVCERSGDFPDRRFSFTPFAFNNFLLKTHREPRRLALNGGKSNRFDAPAGVVYFEAQRRKLYVISNEHYVLTTKKPPTYRKSNRK